MDPSGRSQVLAAERLGGVAAEALEDVALVANGDDAAWLIPLKGEEQPRYSFYHRTALSGGSVHSFADGKWTSNAFAALETDENREGHLFSFASRLFLLIYSHYDEFCLRRLLRWDGKAWEELRLDGAEKLRLSGHRFDVNFAQEAGSDELSIIASPSPSGGHGLVIKLSLAEDKAKAELLMEFSLDLLRPHSMLLAAVRSGDDVYALVGVHGCGVRVESDYRLKLSLSEKKAQLVRVVGDGPGFSGGCRHNGVVEGDWIMLGGTRMGYQSCSSDPSVWRLRLGESQLSWANVSCGSLPAEYFQDACHEASQASAKTFLLYASKHGLLRLRF